MSEGRVRLTARQSEIVELLAQGMTQQDVAEKLGTALQTIKNHMLEARKATGTRNTPELVAAYIGDGKPLLTLTREDWHRMEHRVALLEAMHDEHDHNGKAP